MGTQNVRYVKKTTKFDPSNITRIGVNCNDDIIFCPVWLYKVFLSKGQLGLDAKLLFDHLFFTARLQQHMINGDFAVRATTTYIKNAFGWSEKRIKKAKALLALLKVISYVRIKPSKQNNGRLGQVIILIRIPDKMRRKTVRISDPVPQTANSTGSLGTPVEFATGVVQAPVEREKDDSTGVAGTPVERATGDFTTGVEFNRGGENEQININTININKEREEKKNETVDDIKRTILNVFFTEKNRHIKNSLSSPSPSDIKKLEDFVSRIEIKDIDITESFSQYTRSFLTKDFWFTLDKKTGTRCLTFANFLTHFHEIVDNTEPEREQPAISDHTPDERRIAEEHAFSLLKKEIPSDELEAIKTAPEYRKFGDIYFHSTLIDQYHDRFQELIHHVEKGVSQP